MEQEQIKNALAGGITPFATTTYRNQDKVFGIKTDDRRRHVYVIGKTGMGKTTLIENMVYADILAGNGVCYVDPHGDTAEKMLEWIPNERINDVIYLNPADIDFPISFNVLEKVEPQYRHLISSGLIGVFKKLWADSWGPRLEYLLRNTILALLEFPDSTLLGINRLLVDNDYRKKVIAKVQDPVIRQFWTEEYAKYGGQFQVEAIAPIQNKIGQFLSTSLIRNIVGQVKSSIDLRKVMDEGKILILNLSKGRIGEDASSLLGAMIITKIQLAAMSRVNIPEEERKDFYLYVDEFQNFATDSFKDILSEARKYRLNLIIAHQYIEQLGEVVKPAVFGNVGTLICFRVGATDAEFLEKEFTPYLTQEDLVNLPKWHIYLKLMIDGIASDPFSAKGLPPVYSDSLGNEQKVIKVSRERYAKPRDLVEDKIKRWSESKKGGAKTETVARAFKPKETKQYKDIKTDKIRNKEDQVKDIETIRAKTEVRKTESKADIKSEVIAESKPQGKAGIEQKTEVVGEKKKKKKDKPVKETHKTFCYHCEKEVEVPFKPDNIRPIFCKECLKKARRGQIEVKPPAKEDKQTEKAVAGISLAELGTKTVDFKGKQVSESKKQERQVKPQKPLEKTQAAPQPQPAADLLQQVAETEQPKEEKSEEIQSVDLLSSFQQVQEQPQVTQKNPEETQPEPEKKEEPQKTQQVKPGEIIEL